MEGVFFNRYVAATQHLFTVRAWAGELSIAEAR